MPLTTRYSLPYPSATSPADAPGQLQDLAQGVDDQLNRLDGGVRSLAARSTTSFTLTATRTNLPGTSATFTTNYPNAVAVITATWDLSYSNTTGNTGNHLIGKLLADGNEQPAQALLRTNPNARATVGQTYVVTFPSAGSHTVALCGQTSADSGVGVANAPHTGWAAVLIDR